MAERSNTSWVRTVSSFHASPKSFLSNVAPDAFLDELITDLTSETINEQTKVLMLNLFLEFPNHLCPDQSTGEKTTELLLNILKPMLKSGKSVPFRCHLLLAIETVLITTDNFNLTCKVAQEFASMLMHITADINDRKQGAVNRQLRVTACECLRELENCYPGFLCDRLETLYYMHQQEITYIHQSYTILYTVALKNAVQVLARRGGPNNGMLKVILTSNKYFFWNATEKSRVLQSTSGEQAVLLAPNSETKEIKSVLALLLEDSYLLSPICQNTLFWQITQIVSMISSVSPVVFKSQLVRLFGTMDISFFHSILQMKAVFTDSLFTSEDEHFLLKRLVGMTQHPLLSTAVKLFYLDCLLHFPENRPLNSNPGENLPVLLTVQMTSSLFPTIFNDYSTMLCRQNLLSMVYLENEGCHSETGIGFLFEHLMSLYSMVHRNGNCDITSTFFRAFYLFVRYFNSCEKYMENLIKVLLELYRSQSSLAPYFINLINETQILLEFHSWPISLSKALQKLIVDLPLEKQNVKCLGWHLQVLARVAQENTIQQKKTVSFLKRVAVQSGICQRGDWKAGNAVLSVCKNLLQHQHLDSVFMLLADLLQYLMHHFEDIDIQDHARLYYILLTNVASDKLTKVLTMSPVKGKSKARSLSSIMTENENFSTLLTIHNTPCTVLQLCTVPKVSNDFPVCSEASVLDNSTSDHLLEEYNKQLIERSFFLTMKYHLSFKGDIEPKNHQVFCIALEFEQVDSCYEPISEITVPCLILGREPPVVTLYIIPKDPYPSVIHVNATYDNQDGLTYNTCLEPLQIKFPDIFLPLPLPSSCPEISRAQLFDKLWLTLQPDESNQCEDSTFCYNVLQKSLYDVAQSYFSNFVVVYKGDEYKIGLFLPPQFHILMHIKSEKDIAKFSIRTDNWKLLPLLNSHLLNITSQKDL
ncbi:AP-5 complex subunit beta-1 [Pelobates cultripes]|uniref:AP-5 complex subunit beta-1 n=2 Tax=Pelobates cultripes TaxID=61616 RepID=A0AAD1TAW5_PELCU|nr:AP-5 complex subunit beta-1 [Pelobates cultripes]